MGAKLKWVAETNRRWVGFLGRHEIATIVHLEEPSGHWIWCESLTSVGNYKRCYSFTDAQIAVERSVRTWLDGAGLMKGATG